MANELQILRIRVQIFICACMKWSLFCIRIFIAVFFYGIQLELVGSEWFWMTVKLQTRIHVHNITHGLSRREVILHQYQLHPDEANIDANN